MAEVIKIYPEGADNPDCVLESAIGEFNNVLIIGWNKNNKLDARSDTETAQQKGNILELIELFKHNLLNGVYDE